MGRRHMTAPDWKVVHASVCGTSHIATDAPCQDRCIVSRERAPGGTFLVAVCADGAGSARFAEIGAETACRAVASAITEHLKFSDCLDDPQSARGWVGEAREAVRSEAALRGAPVRDFACTLIGAVIGDGAAMFFQIGDGAAVASVAGCCGVVFWPQGGEYAGTTFFLTDEQWAEQLMVTSVATTVDELALFTDGLERLILRFADQSVHVPFLTPMWSAARQVADGAELIPSLETFLRSTAVVERTDDDKTLVIATRLEREPSTRA